MRINSSTRFRHLVSFLFHFISFFRFIVRRRSRLVLWVLVFTRMNMVVRELAVLTYVLSHERFNLVDHVPIIILEVV